MKKLTLFLVAMFAMVNIANAQRAWAYGLGLESGADSYTFTFKATTAATAILVLYQDGTEVGTVDLGAAVAGDNTFELTKEELPGEGVFNWGVKLKGAAIEEVTEVTAAEDKYYYYLAQDVATNINPESKHFGKMYVLETYAGAGDGASAHSKTQTPGIYVYDPALTLENYAEGYLPSNVTLNTTTVTNQKYRELHRMALNPIKDELAFVQSNAAKVWVSSLDGLKNEEEATNVVAGTGIKASSVCYDENGTMYVLYPYASIATIYKQVDGEFVKFVERNNWGWTDDRNAMESDGRGGLWVVQNIANLATNGNSEDMLTHINAAGEVDFFVNKTSSAELQALMPAASNRGQIGYDAKHDVLALGGKGTVKLFNVTYTEDGPTLSLWQTVTLGGNNVDGLAFDYAGDLIAMSASVERFYKFALPTDDNTCTTPAPKAQVIVLDEAIKQYYLTVQVNGNGEVEGTAAGLYLEGTQYELTATPAENNKFINWTLSDATTSTENPLTGVLNSDLTITANFEELAQYRITTDVDGSDMGTVEGAGMYYEGQEVTLTAKANQGYAFVKWDDETTEPTITFEATADVTRTAYFKKVATRAWAYGLEMTEGADDYTFQFTTTADGEVKILFKDMDGNELKTLSLGTLKADTYTKIVSKTDFADIHKDAYWSVQIDGAEITELAELTADNDAYRFYCPQGVVVDNNTESETFGQIFIAQPMNGGSDGMTARTKAQKRGIFLFDQTLTSLNPTDNTGVLPSNIEWAEKGRQSIHRVAINPKDKQLAMAYNIASGKVWSVATNNVAGEATNLIAGTAITLPNSICFDEEGALYVMDNANATTGGTIYKVVNGVAEVFGAQNKTWANIENALASDGRGGLWFLQYRSKLDGYNLLTHLNADGEIDFAVNVTTPNGFVSQSSYRGAMAYNPREDMLAIGIGPDGQIGVSLYKVTYDETTGVPTVEFFAKTSAIGANVDALGFDYAGDLYVVSAAVERFYKFVVPTEDNICIVPAPAAKKLVLGTQCKVTVTVNDPAMGSVEGAGVYEKGEEVTLTANPVAHHRFAKWTGDKTSTDNPLKFTIEGDVNLTANFEPIPQYTITTSVNDEKMGSVTEGGTYYEGTEVTLTATAKGGYVFVDWSDGLTEETRTFTAGVDMPETLTANFKVAVPRAWAYDLRLDADTDPANYIFTFTATSAGDATIFFTDEEGTSVAPTQEVVGTVAAGETKTIAVAKSKFTGDKDVYWSVKVEGDAIAKIAEVTDPTRNIYDFYNSMGVVVDNNTDSEYFGKIYIQQSYDGASDGIADRSDTQTAGIFIYDQGLNELNAPANTGIKPQLPYTIGGNRQNFKRIAINPTNGHIAFCNNTTDNGGAYSVSRENLTGEAVNLTKHIAEIKKVNALCFDDEGNLYVVANVITQNTPNGSIYQIKKDGTYIKLSLSAENLFVNEDIAMATDGRGGLWIAQNRWGIAAGPLFHVNVEENKIDFKVEAGKDYSDWFAGANYRGAIAYDKQRDILAVHSEKCASVFQVTYSSGVPSISKICQTPAIGGTAIDGLAFDYAGDLYLVSSGTERFYKYVLPTKNNTCTVLAPESQIIMKEARYTVTVEANDNALGTVSGGGEYKAGETITLTATPKDGSYFVNWTVNDIEQSTNDTYSFTVTEAVIVVANFEEILNNTIEPRAWAYNLKLGEEGDNYTFIFTATATADATLHFEYTDGTPAFDHTVGPVTAGPVAPIAIAKSQFAGTKDIRWSVELEGAKITDLAKLTDDSKHDGFWFAYGVGVNNCPESPYFGNIYVSNPRHKNAPEQTGFYKYSPELVLDETIFVDGEKRGYKPSNVDIAALNAVDAIQRMAVSPVDGTVAFVQWNSAPFAAYGMNPANLAGDAVNLTEGINQPVALCYDHEGSLCVLSYDGKSGGVSVYGIHIIKNGEKTTFFSQAGWVAGGYCEIASDGQGGFYVMSGNLNASNVVTSAKLQHISKKGVIDLTVLPGGVELEASPSNFDRLRLAYDLRHNVFAIGGDKKVNLYKATYDAETGVPTLTKWISTPEIGNTVDGVAFDYAGDLYAVSAYTETFYKFVLPTEKNICVVPAADIIEVDKSKYTRDVTYGNFGTICLPYGSNNYSGAEFYEIAYLELQADGVTPKGIWLDEVTGALEAGKPYIFKATSNLLTVNYKGEEAISPVEGKAGLTGTFDGITDETVLQGNYMIAENKFWLCGAGCWLNANRAYIDKITLHANITPTTALPSRRRVMMGAAGENTTTGVDNLTEDGVVSTNQATKMVVNGQLIIIRDGVKYNAQGVRL